VAQGMDTSWFFQNFFNLENGAIAIWSGGLSIFGAVLGGALGAFLYLSRWHNTVTRFFSRAWWIIAAVVGALLIIGGAQQPAPTQTILIVIGAILVLLAVLWLIPQTRGILKRIFGEDTVPFPEKGLPFAPWLDYAGVALPLGQAVGRWANYVNQELYGARTDLPWGITIESAKRVAPYQSLVDYPQTSTLFHPLFLYESIWSFGAFVVLFALYQRNKKSKALRPGDFFLLWVLQYAFIRFMLEFLRLEVTLVGGINFSQIVCGIAFAIAYGLLVLRRGQTTVPEAARAA
jgi:phosphatidylglycerol---prolipoprotein diacylglyceryl transferase